MILETAGLRLDQAPPIHIPFRHFLTAPWFAVAAGALLYSDGAMFLTSRWSPAALASAHLLAVGFLGQVMIGAMLQMLPVLLGAPVPRVALLGSWSHVLLAAGAALMGIGFLGSGDALRLGAAAAALGFGAFLAGALPALVRARGEMGTRTAMRLAAVALILTVLLGLALIAGLSGWIVLPRIPDWVQAHLYLGLLGWMGLLIVGVAYQIVPMFHVTPSYPRLLTRFLTPLIFLALILASALVVDGRTEWSHWPLGLASLGFALFSGITVGLQVRRARPRLDPTLAHWWLAAGAALMATAGWWLDAPAELIGVLVLIGVGTGLTSGMLLKIVPFLAWFHLQSRQVALGRFDVRLPHMNRLVPDRWARWHPLLHGIALALVCMAIPAPELASYGGIALVLSNLWLFGLLLNATIQYSRVSGSLGADKDAPRP